MAPITEEERLKIGELRAAVSSYITPYYDTDFNLLRWLKGHDSDMKQIVPKLLNHLQFRRNPDWNLDGLADRPRDHAIHKHWKSGLTGASGRIANTIVNIEQTGANDYHGMLCTYPVNEVLRARVHDLESMLRAVMDLEKRTGEQCSVMYIMDLEGVKFDKKLIGLVTGALASISAFMAEHYVEMVHSFVLVNVPSFIAAVWNLARPLLPERTKNKVHILGSNWRTEILNFATPDVLPSYWNEEGKEKVFLADVQRGKAFDPAGYYNAPLPADAATLQVGAGKNGYADVEAKKGKRLRWLVHADGHFAFAIHRVSSKDSTETLDYSNRVYPLFNKIPGPTQCPLQDSMAVDQDGTYRFWFSNSHAWLHTLKVTYKIEVIDA